MHFDHIHPTAPHRLQPLPYSPNSVSSRFSRNSIESDFCCLLLERGLPTRDYKDPHRKPLLPLLAAVIASSSSAGAGLQAGLTSSCWAFLWLVITQALHTLLWGSSFNCPACPKNTAFLSSTLYGSWSFWHLFYNDAWALGEGVR